MRAELSRIDLADVLELRLAPDEEDAGADLALRRKGEEDAVRVTDVDREGRIIRARLADLPLEDGVWDVVAIDSTGHSVPVSTRDSGLNLTHRVAYLRCPRTRELRAVRDPQGRLRLSSATVTPYAEVGWVDVTPDAVTVSGMLAYAPKLHEDTTARFAARQRGLDGVLTAPAELDGDRFHCEIPLDPIAEAHEPKRGHNEWDLWLQLPDDHMDLRMAAHADDVVGKKRKVVYASVDLRGTDSVDLGGRDHGEGGDDGDSGDTVVRIRPYYTVKDELSLLATARGGGAR